MDLYIALAAILLLAILNMIVSIKVAKSDFLEIFQKIAHVFIVWFFPVFGALGIWAFIRSIEASTQSDRSGFCGGSSSRRDECAAMDE